MSLNPTRKVLSLMKRNGVECLLMGGQACVLYGAAEFSRDADLAIQTSPLNMDRLQRTLKELCAEVIAVPPFDIRYLKMGLAVHFRCGHPDVEGLRVDIMSKMRGVADFEDCWERRSTLEWEDGEMLDVMSLPDLIRAKKTQRDKVWPMIRRLVEADYYGHVGREEPEKIKFWLKECLTPAILNQLAAEAPTLVGEMVGQRPLLAELLQGSTETLQSLIDKEIEAEKARDREYWKPLKKILEELRHGARG